MFNIIMTDLVIRQQHFGKYVLREDDMQEVDESVSILCQQLLRLVDFNELFFDFIQFLLGA